MALSNLTLSGMEHYGGIDLKKNYRKYFSSALGYSIGLHLLLLLFYFGYSILTAEDESKIPRLRVRSVTELGPPPSTTDQQQEAIPIETKPPADIAKPNLGVPVPVPDAIAPTPIMPDLNTQVQSPITDAGSVGGVIESGPKGPIEIKKEVKEEDPGLEDFVSVDVEPQPVQNIQSMVVYPEVASRSGLEGTVTVAALIGKDGSVEKVEIIKTDFEVFNKPATDAIKKVRFTPARSNGQPTKVWYTVPIRFKLQAGR